MDEMMVVDSMLATKRKIQIFSTVLYRIGMAEEIKSR